MSTLTGPLSATSIKSAIDAMLLQGDIVVPDGHRGVIVQVVNLDRVEVAWAQKIKEGSKWSWNIALMGSHEWAGDNQFGVLNKITFG